MTTKRRTRHSPEQIVKKLRGCEFLLLAGILADWGGRFLFCWISGLLELGSGFYFAGLLV
jgi:hypothetical protein